MPEPFKFVSLDRIRSLSSPIIFVMTEDDVQDFAEDNCGGRLTDDELQAFETAGFEDFSCNLYEWLDETIEASRKMARDDRAPDRRITEFTAHDLTNAESAKTLTCSESSIASRQHTLQAATVA